MKKNKKNKKQIEEVRQLTPDELAEEEKKYNACKKPIQIGWAIYAFAASLYIINGFMAHSTAANITKKPTITEELNKYKYSEEYTDFITEAQKETLRQLEQGEITVDEFNHIMETISSEEKFEEFLRGLEHDKEAQAVIKEYDEYSKQLDTLGKKYAGVSITALSSLMVSSVILAKYRFREMDIEEARRKRAEALNLNEKEM